MPIDIRDKDSLVTIAKSEDYYRFMYIIKQKDNLDKDFFQELVDIKIDSVLKINIRNKNFLLRRIFYKKELQCEEICLAAIKIDWCNYRYIKVKSKKLYLECLKYNSKFAKDLLGVYGVPVEEVLSINGLSLEYVSNPTYEQIVLALTNDGKALKYVKNKTEELKLLAVKQNGRAIQYITNPSDEVCLDAVKNTKSALVLIEDVELRTKTRDIIKNMENKMSFDNFTTEQILSAVKNGGDSEQLADLYRQLKGSSEEGPTEEQVKYFVENQGKEVSINNTNMTGMIVKLNTSTRGFYPGGRYPIYVKILTDDRVGQYNAVGETFEYDLDQLTIIK